MATLSNIDYIVNMSKIYCNISATLSSGIMSEMAYVYIYFTWKHEDTKVYFCTLANLLH